MAVRIFLILMTSLLSSASLANDVEFSSFRIGTDSYDTRSGVFKRLLCLESQDSIEVVLSLTTSEKLQLFRLAQQDIFEGNADLGELEGVCVSSYPYEVIYGDSTGEIKTTCYSPLQDDEAHLLKFVYSIDTVQNLPKSHCRLY
ncbi:hypothetical protein [Pseudoalteromonas sp. SW0106-04]|uniref:hypothetical protein n=1 Tax=Pseudoalteromonas sp. SW0106-04 TaxID=1702169 RepID=UPI000B1209A5|nr:hypothetical protein [Pseudoalteromonas sp. SW0106-04]